MAVALGLILLLQLFFMVPLWLFYSVLVGWLAFAVVAVAVARRCQAAYPFALALAVLTLLVSLPQPEHYAFLNAGLLLAGMTFLFGSALQLCLIILIPIYLIKKRKRS
jgi:hypothetical protein